jgi:hypothetical protein
MIKEHKARVLIFGDDARAYEVLAAEREAGNHASLRSTERVLEDKPEPCDRAVTWDESIAGHYGEKADYRALRPDGTAKENDAAIHAEVPKKKRAKA